MSFLRILDLHSKPILILEPNTLSIKHGNIFKIAQLLQHPVTILCVTKALFMDQATGSYITQQECTIMNYTAVGISDLTNLGKMFPGRIFSANSGYNCDCSLVPILKLAKDWFIVNRDLYNSNNVCEEPAKLRGTDMYKLVESGDFSEMTCSLVECPHPPDPNCDTESCKRRPVCTCSDNQVLVKVVVNCSYLEEMPAFIPYGYWANANIELTVEHGSIQLTNATDYLSRITKLSFVKTTVVEIHPSFIGGLKSDIEIQFSPQSLREIFIEFYSLDLNKLNFGTSPVTCDCYNLWLGEWIRSKVRENQLCWLTGKGVYDAFHVTEELLNCTNEKAAMETRLAIIATGIMLCLMLLIGIIGFYYRYDFFILKRSFSKNNTFNQCIFQFDVFLSYSSNSSYVSKLIEHEVRPMLNQSNYAVFTTFFNISFGDDLESSILNAIDVSKTFVVFVCDAYQTDLRSVIEFNGIWACFKNHPERQIILVNVNSYESNRIHDRRIKAFVRLGLDLNFTNVTANLHNDCGLVSVNVVA
ncbi:hypothetical protein DPMN_042127 [Dreissena polymorpha]|uniref:TIR domain-containing protein n=1 Tax=Dreissena polymorpha TaxID=45954 RepID=A0A9D4D0G7_DREPO|nr:hypothetical protein DPMN_042127 [Dreissena polymorpha]